MIEALIHMAGFLILCAVLIFWDPFNWHEEGPFEKPKANEKWWQGW